MKQSGMRLNKMLVLNCENENKKQKYDKFLDKKKTSLSFDFDILTINNITHKSYVYLISVFNSN